METKEKKELASNWFRDLRDTFCSSFELIEGNKFSFERKSWPHRHSGGGEMSIMKGEVFEKVGVNISTVSGKFQEDFREQIKGTEQSPEYFEDAGGDNFHYIPCLNYDDDHVEFLISLIGK